MPLRREPFVGLPVTVVYLARSVGGTIEEVRDGGLRLVVVTEDGDRIAFALSRATGSFAEEPHAVGGARLTFGEALADDGS